jgi:hypothetical protein
VPIWIDEIPDVQAWAIDFSKTEAHEVVTALGAWIYVYRRPVTKTDYVSLITCVYYMKPILQCAKDVETNRKLRGNLGHGGQDAQDNSEFD